MTTNATNVNESYDCDLCSQSYESESALKRHRSIHNEAGTHEYECSDCDFGTDTEMGLSVHRARMHDDEETHEYECNDCDFGTDTEYGLNVHRGLVHPEPEDHEYECDQCDFSTNSKAGFSSHKSQKHDVDFTVEVECDVCGTAVSRKKYEVGNVVFCSGECKSEYWSGGNHSSEFIEKRISPQRKKVDVECDYCGNVFERTPKRVEDYEHQYCDFECKSQHQSITNKRSNHPRWSGGESGINYVRKHISDTHWKKIAAEVRDEYDNTCQKCGYVPDDEDRSLDVHHIIPLTAGGTNDEELLIPLCLDCHRTVESYTEQFVDNYFVE